MPDIDPIAAYGALVATGVALWNGWNTWSARRRRLRVTAYIGTIYVPTGVVTPDYQPAGRQVVFKAQNDGPLSVRVQSCGLARTKWRWGKRVVTARLQLTIPENVQFPQDVGPGHSLDASAELLTFCGSTKPGGWAGYERPYFTDAVGRTYLGNLDGGFMEELESIAEERQRALDEFAQQSNRSQSDMPPVTPSNAAVDE